LSAFSVEAICVPPAMIPLCLLMKTPLAHCQLGYRPQSPKTLTLLPTGDTAHLPDRIPFFLRDRFMRLERDHAAPAAWQGQYFRWPFDLKAGKLTTDSAHILFQGELQRIDSRWGPLWQGNFDGFTEPGYYQIETDWGSTFPFKIDGELYSRIEQGYLNYLYCQRSGMEIPGIRPLAHLDDGRLDRDGSQIDAAGGWYDAGDLRKWMFLTQPNLQSLATLAERGHPELRKVALEEIRWGNRFFQAMIAPDGQCWEDLAGGDFKAGLIYEEHWWYENHPGCNCNNAGGIFTDNIPASGDERWIRSTYNPAVQFMFIRTQCRVAPLLSQSERQHAISLAERAWDYGVAHPHDGRTLFLAEELWAALELQAAGSDRISNATVTTLTHTLLERQDTGEGGLSGYFMEKGETDGFRCIAASCEPAMALLRIVELAPAGLEHECEAARTSIQRYIEDYLLADATSNPFALTPYGVYVDPVLPEHQTFRDAGRGRGVRTFIHPFSQQQVVHGTGGVIAHQAALLSKAGKLLEHPEWQQAAEKLIQWLLGHNTESLCLHTGVGYEHPTPFSGYVAHLPNAICVGHIGRPDDRPYLETSELIEWSTQEVWDIPHAYLAEAVLWL
jgi:hypothetical protein